MKERITSRKFIVTVAVALIILANKKLNLGLNDDAINQLITVALGYGVVNAVSKIIKEVK